MQKLIYGDYVELELVGETKEEVIQWRNFFWNWGAIKVCDSGNNCSESLDKQESEIDEFPDGYHLKFFLTRKGIIEAYKNSMITKIDWEKHPGKKNRLKIHKEIEQIALDRFNNIPKVKSHEQAKSGSLD